MLACLAIAGGVSHGADDWLVISGWSRHVRHPEEYRQWNPGIGWESAIEHRPASWMAGYYRNSHDLDTVYAGARWEPLQWGALKTGAFFGVASGYWSPLIALPMASVRSGPVGFNVVAAPRSVATPAM